MDVAALLLHKLDALERHIAAPEHEEYELLSASAILRHLLLDELVSTANRSLRIAIRFEIARFATLESDLEELTFLVEQPALLASVDEMDPAFAPAHWPRLQLPLDRFLSHHVIAVQGSLYSVRDVISFAANAEGGVHHGAPKERLADLTEGSQLLIRGVPVPLTILRPISRVTLAGLRPLREALHQAPPGQPMA